MLAKQSNLFKAIIVTLIMGALAYIGFDLPRDVVEEAVETVLSDIATGPTPSIPSTGVVTFVHDGDTLVVANAGQEYTVRLIGIDTPEVAGSPAGAECYGSEASEQARALLQGQTVTLSTDPSQATYDRYERLLAYVTLPDNSDFGERMLAVGAAQEFTFDTPYQKQSRYRTAERTAQQAQAGLWGTCTD